MITEETNMATKTNIAITVAHIVGSAIFLTWFATIVPPGLLTVPAYATVGATSTLVSAWMLWKLLERRDARERHAKQGAGGESAS